MEAFTNDKINSLTLSEGLLSIGDQAFYTNDMTEVTIPNSVQTIGSLAFYDCDSLESVTIGTDVTSIGASAFGWGTTPSLTTVNYNAKNCTTVGDHAFNNGPITTVTIGEDVESIPTGLFNYTNDGTNRDGSTYSYGFHIQTLNYNAKNCTQACTREETTDEDGLRHYKYSDFPFENSASTIKTVTIGEAVDSIPAFLFYNCTALETVYFNATACYKAGDTIVWKNYTADEEASVKRMAKARSLAATGMQGELDVPQSVAAAADPSASGLLTASSRRKVAVLSDDGDGDDGDGDPEYESEEDYREGRDKYTADTDMTIIYSVFYGCTNLKTLVMGDNVHRVPAYLCYNISSLDDLTMGENVLYIGRSAFSKCALTTLTIPENVTDMEDGVFNENPLQTVTYKARDCELAGHFDYENTEENMDYYFVIFYDCPIENFYVTETVDTIPRVLGLGLDSLRNLTFEEGVQSIGYAAFEHCPVLPSVTFPASLNVLEGRAFARDSALVEITIPATLDSIKGSAFNSCASLTTVYAPATPTYCEANAFYDIAENSWLVVPEDYACAYTTDGTFQATKATKTGWSDIANLREDKVSLTPLSANDYYTTCYSPYEYTLDPGVKGAIIQSVTESDSQNYTDNGVTEYTLTISWNYDGSDESKNVVPAGTALLIQSTSEDTFANLTQNASATAVEGNLMGGSTNLNVDNSTVKTTVGDGSNDSDYYFYRFTYGNKSPFDKLLGFYRMDTDGSPFNITKKKAWLAIPKTQIDVSGANLPLISFVESDGSDSDVNLEIGSDSDGETTGISSLASEDVAGAVIYNMAGQRVNDMNRKGIYIISGKKVIKK
ncbi:MAG: leucine-rich repeat domain-containing protein [Prevotella sp.]|nr:leucine-rich repeat domain-containing protein [Prevotella sp.]